MSRELFDDRLLSTEQAAQRLGVSRLTLYDWLAKSDAGTLVIGGREITVEYLQTGPSGQGRIRIATHEVERLIELMRVRPQRQVQRRPPIRLQEYPGITVPLGRPGNDVSEPRRRG